MRSLKTDPRMVTGQTLRLIARERLAADTWDIDLRLGSPGAVSTATVVVRAAGSGTNLLTFTSAAAPARLASQRLTLAVATELEFYAYNSLPDVGSVVVEDIRIVRAPLQLWTNGIVLGLGAPIGSGDGTITLEAGGGAAIGLSPTGGQFFLLTVYTDTAFEVMRCTSRTGDVLTVTRGQEGSAAAAWLITANVTIAATAVSLSNIQASL